jgi:alpha-glucosidase
MLGLYRRLITLRRHEPALTVGSYAPVDAPEGSEIVCYLRQHGDSRLLVALNLGSAPQAFTPDAVRAGGQVVLSTHLDREADDAREIALRPNEGLIVRLPSTGRPPA